MDNTRWKEAGQCGHFLFSAALRPLCFHTILHIFLAFLPHHVLLSMLTYTRCIQRPTMAVFFCAIPILYHFEFGMVLFDCVLGVAETHSEFQSLLSKRESYSNPSGYGLLWNEVLEGMKFGGCTWIIRG